MKQLVCEMCGGTDWAKEDGMFVCQGCGMKYSVEEAKKLMAEVDENTASVSVKNAAQLENLLNLAQSSYDSKNYAQAESFCNQVIAMDSTNYKAWLLKGQAINYQINASNQRILEVYNCLMTAYRVLSDDQKEEEKYEILAILKDCFEGEVSFWLKQFEANRPTDAALTRVKNSYVDAYNKMAAVFDELELVDSKEGYLINFDNYFVGQCNATCNDAWESTVGYNYYRDYMGQGKDPFGRTDCRWVIADTDLYRPTKTIWDTFLEEADNLIELLQFAEQQFNDDTNPKVMEAIYSNIAFFEECVILSGSWKITQGYTSNWDQYKSVGWHEEYSLTDSAKAARRTVVNKYREKEKNAPKEAEARQRAKKEKERQERIAAYWEEYAEEKAKLEQEQQEIKQKMDALNAQITAIEQKNRPTLQKLTNERNKKLPCEEEVDKQHEVIRDLESQKSKCGIFKGKEKKAIQARIDTEEQPKLITLQKQAEAQKKEHQTKLDVEIKAVKNEGSELREELAKLKKRSDEISVELTKDR